MSVFQNAKAKAAINQGVSKFRYSDDGHSTINHQPSTLNQTGQFPLRLEFLWVTSLPLTIHLFGPLQVSINGAPMPRVRTRSVEWLLALLVLRYGRDVERSWLAGTLWPESEESQSLQNLRHALVSLRKALGPESERIKSPTRDLLTLDLEG